MHLFVVMLHPGVPALFKAKESRPFDLAGCVLRAGISAKAVITHADDEGWSADFVEGGRNQAVA